MVSAEHTTATALVPERPGRTVQLCGPVAIVGAGAAGLALAAALAARGVRARVCNRGHEPLAALDAQGGVRVRWPDMAPETARLEAVSANIPATVAGSEVVFLATGGGVEEDLLAGLLAVLEGTRVVVCVSGRCGAAAACREVLRESCAPRTPLLAELALPLVAMSDAPGSVRVLGEKAWAPLGFAGTAAEADRGEQEAVAALLHALFPCVECAPSALWTSLHCLPGIIFPAVMLANAARVARGEDFSFYGEGVPDGIEPLLQALDDERSAIAQALDLVPITGAEWFARSYRIPRTRDAGIAEVLAAAGGVYPARRAPTDLRHRFLVENIPLCVVALVALARRLGVATPALDALTDLGGALVGIDLRARGEARARWVPGACEAELGAAHV